MFYQSPRAGTRCSINERAHGLEMVSEVDPRYCRDMASSRGATFSGKCGRRRDTVPGAVRIVDISRLKIS